ncbi:hypothetical protein GMD78_00680 [Ornithinibacillus sp. L9]|uniref:YkoP-like domain-containing protein n=1 Tax=Ornithinibacillus caprae TaxID=2678566 RepID=A0A6N8FFU3_9BACI|nr:hypothetical protein [Ornithinibacillus caprae]MUK86917.1 hypothetical protein [Ornithinibacillus caprae]
MDIRKTCLRVWSVWDPIYYSLTRLEYVENEWGNRTIIRVRLTKYKGRSIKLMDGTVIHKNDILLKIHLHNVKLMKEVQTYDSDIRRALMIYKIVEESLPTLVNYIESHGYNNKIKGLIGITTLHKGCKKLGFEVYPFRNKYYKWFKQFALLPIHLIATLNVKREIPTPMYLMMSKNELFKKYH